LRAAPDVIETAQFWWERQYKLRGLGPGRENQLGLMFTLVWVAENGLMLRSSASLRHISSTQAGVKVRRPKELHRARAEHQLPSKRLLDVYRCSMYSGHMNKRRTMQETSFLILTALAGGSHHGYGIVTDVDQISDGRVELKAGTLYAALDRLTADGLIEFDREEIVDNRLRRYYRVTRSGAERLAELADRRANAHAALTRLRPGVAIS
jgi:PadR family transcriptional regulator PadR